MEVLLLEPPICGAPCCRTIMKKTIGVEIDVANGNYSKVYRGVVMDKPENQKKMENHFTIIQNQETGGITMINNEYVKYLALKDQASY